MFWFLNASEIKFLLRWFLGKSLAPIRSMNSGQIRFERKTVRRKSGFMFWNLTMFSDQSLFSNLTFFLKLVSCCFWTVSITENIQFVLKHTAVWITSSQRSLTDTKSHFTYKEKCTCFLDFQHLSEKHSLFIISPFILPRKKKVFCHNFFSRLVSVFKKKK